MRHFPYPFLFKNLIPSLWLSFISLSLAGAATLPPLEETSPFCEIALTDIQQFQDQRSPEEISEGESAVDQEFINKLVNDLVNPLLDAPIRNSTDIARAALDELGRRRLSGWESVVFWRMMVDKILPFFQWSSMRGSRLGPGGEVTFEGSVHLLVIATTGPHTGHIYRGLITAQESKGIWQRVPVIPYRSLRCRTCAMRQRVP